MLFDNSLFIQVGVVSRQKRGPIPRLGPYNSVQGAICY